MSQQPRRWSRYAFVLVLSALGVAILFLWSVREARRSAERRNHLWQIGWAIHSFHDANKRLPKAVYSDEQGQPLSSWRFRVVPFLESIMRDVDYGAPWDDSANHWLTCRPHPVFCFRADQSTPESLHTNVVLITGPGTAFDGDRTCSLSDIDGDTIIAIEIAETGIHWAAPGDLPIEEVTPSILQGLDGEGIHVLFADGQVEFVPSDVSLQDVKKFFTIEGAKKYDRKDVLGM